jgi:hypothetical protein
MGFDPDRHEGFFHHKTDIVFDPDPVPDFKRPHIGDHEPCDKVADS